MPYFLKFWCAYFHVPVLPGSILFLLHAFREEDVYNYEGIGSIWRSKKYRMKTGREKIKNVKGLSVLHIFFILTYTPNSL